MQQSVIPKNLDAMTPAAPAKPASVQALLNGILDGEGFRKRFDEVLGARAPQFVSSLVSLINADSALRQAAVDAPLTIIQSALKAAALDLPIDPALGLAYICPFHNKGKSEAQFIIGYRGLIQLALRTGAYSKLTVVDVREGEFQSFDRLTETLSVNWIEDEAEREKREIVGWIGYFKLTNGFEKAVYMSRNDVLRHEKKHRKGQEMSRAWREDFNAMAEKTVLRKLLGKYALLSVTYQQADPAAIKAADDLLRGCAEEDALEAEAAVE